MSKSLEKFDELYNTVLSLDSVYNRWAKKYKISKNEVCTLSVLLNNLNKKITQRQICEDIGTPFTTLNSTIKNLEEKGYISLIVNNENKKEKYIMLTKKGEKYTRNIIDPLNEIEEKAANSISIEEFDIVIACLNKCKEKLSKYIDEMEEK